MSEADEGAQCNQEIKNPISYFGGVIVFASSELLIWMTGRSLKREAAGPDLQTQSESVLR